MSSKVRFGIAGMDHWYAGFGALRGVAGHESAVVTAAAHRKTAYLEAAAAEFGIPYTTDDYDEIVRRDDVDVVVAACTTVEAPALCLEAAQHGKHIICVKPMALTLDDADAVVAAVNHAGVGFFPLEAIQASGGAARQYGQWLQEGRIGDPISATVIRRGGLPTQEWPGVHVARTWWLDAGKAPGGGWIDHAIYDVHMLRKLLQAEVVRVTGATANLVHKDIPLEDFGVATLTFDNGVVATLEVTWSSGPQAGMHACAGFSSWVPRGRSLPTASPASWRCGATLRPGRAGCSPIMRGVRAIAASISWWTTCSTARRCPPQSRTGG